MQEHSESIADQEVIAHWQEPSSQNLGSNLPILQASLALGGLSGALILVALWQKTFGLYIAAAACLTLLVVIITGKGKAISGREITITDSEITIGKHSYPLAECAGFWLEFSDTEATIINFELQRPGALPISCCIPTDQEEAREILLEVLPELEAREKTEAERFFAKLRF